MKTAKPVTPDETQKVFEGTVVKNKCYLISLGLEVGRRNPEDTEMQEKSVCFVFPYGQRHKINIQKCRTER